MAAPDEPAIRASAAARTLHEERRKVFEVETRWANHQEEGKHNFESLEGVIRGRQ